MLQTQDVEKIKTHFMFNTSPSPRKSYRLWDNVEKCCTAEQVKDDSTPHAQCMLDT